MNKATMTAKILIGFLASIFMLCEIYSPIKLFLFNYCTFWGTGVLEGQVWRLISGAFLHGSIAHIMFNCFFLWQIFPWIAYNFGLTRAHIVLWSSVLGGAVLSGVAKPDDPGVGISGGCLVCSGFISYLCGH